MLFKTISPGIAWSTLEVQLGSLHARLRGDAIMRLMKGDLIVLSMDNYEISQVIIPFTLPAAPLAWFLCLHLLATLAYVAMSTSSTTMLSWSCLHSPPDGL